MQLPIEQSTISPPPLEPSRAGSISRPEEVTPISNTYRTGVRPSEAPISLKSSNDSASVDMLRSSELMKSLQYIDDGQTRVLTSIAFESSGDHDPRNADYDEFIQGRAAASFGKRNSWGSYKKRSGLYRGSFQTLNGEKIYTFHAVLRWEDSPVVTWICWQDQNNDIAPIDISFFKSPFAASEIYGIALHLPVEAFKGLLNYNETDKEVIVLTAVQNGSDGKTMDSFNGRVYLRPGLNLLEPRGQISFLFESELGS
jgi:hypothetical protein